MKARYEPDRKWPIVIEINDTGHAVTVEQAAELADQLRQAIDAYWIAKARERNTAAEKGQA